MILLAWDTVPWAERWCGACTVAGFVSQGFGGFLEVLPAGHCKGSFPASDNAAPDWHVDCPQS